MTTLGQMDVVSNLLRGLEKATGKPEIEQARVDGLIDAANRIVALFDGEPDPYPSATQTIANIATQKIDKEPYEGLVVFALSHCEIKVVPRRLSRAISSIATQIAYAVHRELVAAKTGMSLDAWLNSDDTGGSSFFIAAVLADEAIPIPNRRDRLESRYSPRDSADFGRCYRLLLVMPEWVGRLPEVAEKGGATWSRLVAEWPRLTELYQAGSFREVSEIISAIEREARNAEA